MSLFALKYEQFVNNMKLKGEVLPVVNLRPLHEDVYMEMSGQLHAPASLHPGKEPTVLIG
jgi:hypothetical protein